MSDTLANSSTDSCPRCGKTGVTLQRIEAGLRLRLQEEGGVHAVPDSVCSSCVQTLNGQLSAGAVLRREMELKEQHKASLYKNRMQMVKQAKTLVAQKQFSEAAILYEKYLRVLELVFDKQPGDLSPETFSTPGRSQELTVIAGVYWDLLNIYDTSNRYGDRQAKVALKLAEFARYTPLFQSIVRQAEKKTKRSKNPEAYKLFMRESNARRPRCFIASSAFEGIQTPEITALCEFREQVLRKSIAGRFFIRIYETVSPGLADYLDTKPNFKPTARLGLRKIVKLLARVWTPKSF